jgi:hypothetical protein
MLWPVTWRVDALGGTITDPAWRNKYLVTTEDRMIPPPRSGSCRNTLRSAVVEVGGSHTSMSRAGGGCRIRLSRRQRLGCRLIEVDYRAMAA